MNFAGSQLTKFCEL